MPTTGSERRHSASANMEGARRYSSSSDCSLRDRQLSHENIESIPTRLPKVTASKPAANPLQFVKIGPCDLYRSAQEQIKKVEEVKKIKQKRDEAEDWQLNLDSWKNSRRKRQEHIIERVVEVKKFEHEEYDRNRKRSKTFNEMMEERSNRGRKVSLVVYKDDDNDLSDLGIGTTSTNSSECADDVQHERSLADEKDTSDTTCECSQNDINGKHEELSSSQEPQEYTYEQAIQSYVNFAETRVRSKSASRIEGMQDIPTETKQRAELKQTKSQNLEVKKEKIPPPVAPKPKRFLMKSEEKIADSENRNSFDLDNNIDSSKKISLPQVDILKRREIFEKGLDTKENSVTNNTALENLTNSKTVKERLSSLGINSRIATTKKKNDLCEKISVQRQKVEESQQINHSKDAGDNILSSQPAIRDLKCEKIVDSSAGSQDSNQSVHIDVTESRENNTVVSPNCVSLGGAENHASSKPPLDSVISSSSTNCILDESLPVNSGTERPGSPVEIFSSDKQKLHSSLDSLDRNDWCEVGSESLQRVQSLEVLKVCKPSRNYTISASSVEMSSHSGDTDHEDSGIHTADASCSMSQADESADIGDMSPINSSTVIDGAVNSHTATSHGQERIISPESVTSVLQEANDLLRASHNLSAEELRDQNQRFSIPVQNADVSVQELIDKTELDNNLEINSENPISDSKPSSKSILSDRGVDYDTNPLQESQNIESGDNISDNSLTVGIKGAEQLSDVEEQGNYHFQTCSSLENVEDSGVLNNKLLKNVENTDGITIEEPSNPTTETEKELPSRLIHEHQPEKINESVIGGTICSNNESEVSSSITILATISENDLPPCNSQIELSPNLSPLETDNSNLDTHKDDITPAKQLIPCSSNTHDIPTDSVFDSDINVLKSPLSDSRGVENEQCGTSDPLETSLSTNGFSCCNQVIPQSPQIVVDSESNNTTEAEDSGKSLRSSSEGKVLPESKNDNFPESELHPVEDVGSEVCDTKQNTLCDGDSSECLAVDTTSSNGVVITLDDKTLAGTSNNPNLMSMVVVVTEQENAKDENDMKMSIDMVEVLNNSNITDLSSLDNTSKETRFMAADIEESESSNEDKNHFSSYSFGNVKSDTAEQKSNAFVTSSPVIDADDSVLHHGDECTAKELNTSIFEKDPIAESVSKLELKEPKSDDPVLASAHEEKESHISSPKSEILPLNLSSDIEILDGLSFPLGPLTSAEPPKEKPPPPPPEDTSDDEAVQGETSLRRLDSTRRIKKEIRRKRTDFLGIEGNADDSYLEPELRVAPPPDMTSFLMEEQRLQKEFYRQSICSESDSNLGETTDSRDSGVELEKGHPDDLWLPKPPLTPDVLSAEHSRQNSENYGNMSVASEDDEIAKKEREIIEILEKEEQWRHGNNGTIQEENVGEKLTEKLWQLEQEKLKLEWERSQEAIRKESEENVRRENELRQRVRDKEIRQQPTELQTDPDVRIRHQESLSHKQQRGHQMHLSLQDISSTIPPVAQYSPPSVINTVIPNYRHSLPDLQHQYPQEVQQYQQINKQHTQQPQQYQHQKQLPMQQMQPQHQLQQWQQQHPQQLQQQPQQQQQQRLNWKTPSTTQPIPARRSLPPQQEKREVDNHVRNSWTPTASNRHKEIPPPPTSQMQGQQMSRQTLQALSAVPRSRLIPTDNWLQAKRKPAPQRPTLNNQHWLIQEAEQRRITEQQQRIAMSPPKAPVPVPQVQSPQWASYPQQQKKPLPDSVINTLTQRVQNRVDNKKFSNRIRGPESQNRDQLIAPPAVPNTCHNTTNVNSDPHEKMLSVSGKKKCSHCGEELGRGAAMIIESLRLFYHIDCFKCCVCHIQLGDGLMGTDVRVRNNKLHCHNCYSSDDGVKFSCV